MTKNARIPRSALIAATFLLWGCSAVDTSPPSLETHAEADVPADDDAAGTDGDVTDDDATGTDGDVTDDDATGTNGDHGNDTNTGEDNGEGAITDPDEGHGGPAGPSACTPESGVYGYCNAWLPTPCDCGNVCGDQIMESSPSVTLNPLSSHCLAECQTEGANDECPFAWEVCGKMSPADPQPFCMPTGVVSGTWRARIFETTEDFTDESVIRDTYMMPNDGITVDVGWWRPEPAFRLAMVAYGEATAGVPHYMLTLVPEAPIEHGIVKDKWTLQIAVPEHHWRAQTLSLRSNRAAFTVAPILVRLEKPNISLRTWVYGIARTSSVLTIDDPGEVCNRSDVENCAVATGSFRLDLFGLVGTVAEE